MRQIGLLCIGAFAVQTLATTPVPDTESWECYIWRQTGGCDWEGPREPDNDKDCTAEISTGASGFCECSGGQLNFNCGTASESFTCNFACANPSQFPGPAPPPVIQTYVPAPQDGKPLGQVDYMNSCGMEPVVSLTFDDGPRIGKIEQVLETLSRRNVKATFFITPGININEPADEEPMCDAVKNILRGGHQIESHTWTHTLLHFQTVEEFKAELDLVEEWYYTCIGGEFDLVSGVYNLTYFRPPSGAISEVGVDYYNYFGYTVANWNVDFADWSGGSTADMYTRFAAEDERLPPNTSSVVLMHDWAFPDDSTTVERNLLDLIIDYYEAKMYHFVTIDECHGLCWDKTSDVNKCNTVGGVGTTDGTDAPGSNTAVPATESWDCVMWHQTGGCSAGGPREPSNDLSCTTVIGPGPSGYCQCSGGQIGFDCGQPATSFTCEYVCAHPSEF